MNLKKKIKIFFVNFIVVVTINGVAVFQASAQQMVDVPPLIGKQLSDAKTELKNAKLKVGEITYVDQGCKYILDDVTETDPPADTPVKKNSKVDLYVNKEEPVEVPFLLGMTIDMADTELSKEDLVGKHIYDDVLIPIDPRFTCCIKGPSKTTLSELISRTEPRHKENMKCQSDKFTVTTYRDRTTVESCDRYLDPKERMCI